MTRKNLFAPLTMLLLSGSVLTGCATIKDRSTQLIKVETPGAEQAFCELRRPGFRSRDWAPMTVRITKSKGPMTVTCVAEGNRQVTMTIKPTVPDSYHENVWNLGIGSVYDYESGAEWKYPDEILVDFTGMQPQPMPPPEYTKLLRDHPEIGGMETFRPGVAALPSDRGEVTPELTPRDPGENNDLGGGLDDNAQIIKGGGAANDSGAATGAAPANVPSPAAPASASPQMRNGGSISSLPTPAPAQLPVPPGH